MREFATRPGYTAEQLAKLLPVLARALAATGEPALAGRTLVEGIGRLAPCFRERPRALAGPMHDVVRALRTLAPGRMGEIPPDIAALGDRAG